METQETNQIRVKVETSAHEFAAYFYVNNKLDSAVLEQDEIRFLSKVRARYDAIQLLLARVPAMQEKVNKIVSGEDRGEE